MIIYVCIQLQVFTSGSLSSAGKNILHAESPLVTEQERRLELKNTLLRERANGRMRLVQDPWGRVVGKDTEMLNQQIAEKAAANNQRLADEAVSLLRCHCCNCFANMV